MTRCEISEKDFSSVVETQLKNPCLDFLLLLSTVNSLFTGVTYVRQEAKKHGGQLQIVLQNFEKLGIHRKITYSYRHMTPPFGPFMK